MLDFELSKEYFTMMQLYVIMYIFGVVKKKKYSKRFKQPYSMLYINIINI